MTFEVEALDALVDALFRRGARPGDPTVEAAVALRAAKLSELRTVAGIEPAARRRRPPLAVVGHDRAA